MKNSEKVIWLIDGEIKDVEPFEKVVKEAIQTAGSEEFTHIYWWSVNGDKTRFSDLDCYADEHSAVEHVERWMSRHNDDFERCAKNERVLILGEVSEELRQKLLSLKPHFMSFYGGFSKDKPAGAAIASDVIWSLEGRIRDKHLFLEAMETLTKLTEKEEGSLMHWWCVDEEDKFVVLEHYADDAAAMAHLLTWNEFGHLFLRSVEVVRYVVYSDLSDELARSIEGLDPIAMRFAGGFSK